MSESFVGPRSGVHDESAARTSAAPAAAPACPACRDPGGTRADYPRPGCFPLCIICNVLCSPWVYEGGGAHLIPIFRGVQPHPNVALELIRVRGAPNKWVERSPCLCTPCRRRLACTVYVVDRHRAARSTQHLLGLLIDFRDETVESLRGMGEILHGLRDDNPACHETYDKPSRTCCTASCDERPLLSSRKRPLDRPRLGPNRLCVPPVSRGQQWSYSKMATDPSSQAH